MITMLEYLKQELDGREFDTIKEYNDCVRAIVADMEDELGKAERFFTSDSDEAYSEAGVVIQQVLDEEEE